MQIDKHNHYSHKYSHDHGANLCRLHRTRIAARRLRLQCHEEARSGSTARAKGRAQPGPRQSGMQRQRTLSGQRVVSEKCQDCHGSDEHRGGNANSDIHSLCRPYDGGKINSSPHRPPSSLPANQRLFRRWLRH